MKTTRFSARNMLLAYSLFLSTSWAYTTISTGSVSGTWSSGTTYYVSGSIDVTEGNTLTVEAGAIIKFAVNTKLTVYGTLDVNGSSESLVTITSINDDCIGETISGLSTGSPSPGDWYGIAMVKSGSSVGIANFDYCRVAYGGLAGYMTSNANVHFYWSESGSFNHSISEYSANYGVRITDCSPVIQNSTIRDCGASGIYSEGSNAPVITTNTFADNAGYGVSLTNATCTAYSGNTGSGNAYNGLMLDLCTVDSDISFSTTSGFPLIITRDLTVNNGKTLTIPAGTIIKGQSNGRILVKGTLDVNGESGSEVIFTSLLDDTHGGDTYPAGSSSAAGDWVGIQMVHGASDQGIGLLDYCLVRYAGSIDYYGANTNVSFSGSTTGNFTNSISEYSEGFGIRITDCAPSISASTFRNNAGSGLLSEGSASATIISNNTFNSNTEFGANIKDGTATAYSGNTGSGNGTNSMALRQLTVNSDIAWSTASGFPIQIYGNNTTVNEYCTLTFSAGLLRIDDQMTLAGAGNFALSAGATLESKLVGSVDGPTESIAISGTRTFDPAANYILSAVGAQGTGSHFPTLVNDLTINNSAYVTLSNDLTINGILTLTSGNLITDANTLTIGTSASSPGAISRTSGTVVGNLKRWFAASTVDDVLFPVGTASYYQPLNVSFTSAPSVGGTLSATVTASDPGSNGVDLSSDPVQDGNYLVTSILPDGYWTLVSADGLSGGSYSLDVTADGFADISDYTGLHLLKRANASSDWTSDGSHGTTTGSNSTPVLHRTGMSGFSQFAVGEGEALPPVTLTATSGTTSTSYNTLKETFNAINAGTHTGEINILINSDITETLSPTLNGSGMGAASYSSVLIRPSSENITVSGAVGTLIYLNGADNVTVDGRVNGTGSTKNLTLHNTSVAGTDIRALFFNNDASSNTIHYVTLRGRNRTFNQKIYGGVVHFGAGSTTGNNKNILNYCDIDGEGYSFGCVFSGSSSGSTPRNTGNAISNCNIYDFCLVDNVYADEVVGIKIYSWGNGDWTITGNSLFQTASRAHSYAITTYGILNDNSNSNCIISGNFIGGSAPQCGGSAWTETGKVSMRGIYCYVNASVASEIQGNTITNLNISTSTGTFVGIDGRYGKLNLGTSSGNIIGSATEPEAIQLSASSTPYVYGIYCSSTALVAIQNNIIGGFKLSLDGAFYGIYHYTSSAESHTVSNNLIGSLTQSSSIRGISSLPVYMYGIYSSASGNTTLSGNTIANMNNESTHTFSMIRGCFLNNSGGTVSGNTVRDLSMSAGNTSSGDNSAVSGIYAVYSNNPNNVSITDNDIYSLSSSHVSAAVETNGIYYKNTGTGCIIEKNCIYDITHATSSTISSINGIWIANGPVTVANNMISLGSGVSTALNLRGIAKSTTYANSICYNSVRIGGTVTGTAVSTHSQAFFRSAIAADNLENNIFANFRTNNGSTQMHFAVNLNATTNVTADYNLLYTEDGFVGTADNGSVTYTALGDWQSGVSLDGHSVSADPLFHSLNAPYLVPSSPASNLGTPVSGINDDFVGSARDESTPDIGAFEFSANSLSTSGTITNPEMNTENVMVALSGVGGVTVNPSSTLSGKMSGYYYNAGRTGAAPEGYPNLSPYYWVLSSDLSSFETSARFYFNNISNNGVIDPNTLVLVKREHIGDAWVVYADVTRASTYIQANGLTSFSEFALAGASDNSLPVELTTFTAESRNGSVILEWFTDSEIENLGFLIDRREVTNSTWKEIASFSSHSTLQGQGSTNTPSRYDYVDFDVESGKSYEYRLSDMDYAGKISQLKVLQVLVRSDDTQLLPEDFQLFGNYPNPFNPSTTIRYGLAEDSNVSLVIYDVRGQVVQTLESGHQSAGWYNVVWNGQTADGKIISTGIYFTRLVAGDYSQVIKMLYLR